MRKGEVGIQKAEKAEVEKVRGFEIRALHLRSVSLDGSFAC
jgi:hypothetical protein